MPDPDIFLSYNREDVDRARQFAAAFAAEGFDVWWDVSLRSGQTYDEVTEEALHSAKAVVVLWSPRSVASRWVRAEATVADQNKTLLPVTIEPCRRPVKFELTQTAELSHWRGDVNDPAWQDFIADVRSFLGLKANGSTMQATPTPTAGARDGGVPERLSSIPGFDVVVAKLKRAPTVLIAVALLLAAIGAWAIFGGDNRPGSGDRIPVVVRQLTATTSGDQTEAALASGITDELIERLRRVQDLRVATAAPDGSAPSDAFRTAYIIDGTIRTSGERVRVAVRLLDARGEVLWSQTFDRRLVDLFEVQELIAANVGDALSVSLDVGADSSKYGGTDNPEAFAAFLQFQAGSGLVRNRFLERAVALDPHYGKALTALVVSDGVQANRAPTRREALALLARMDEVTTRMVAANPDLWLTHVARGYYYANRRDFLAADASFRRAEDLNPGVGTGPWGEVGAWDLNMGRTRKALSLSESMEIIDPVYRRSPTRLWLYHMLGRHRDTIELYDWLAVNNPRSVAQGNPYAFWSHLLLLGEADAIEFARANNMSEVADDFEDFKADLPRLSRMSPTELQAWAHRRYGEGGLAPLAERAMMASYHRQPALALSLIRLALEGQGAYPMTVLWRPAMANARKTDQFEQLVADLGLVKVWRETGDWPDACRPVSAREITCT